MKNKNNKNEYINLNDFFDEEEHKYKLEDLLSILSLLRQEGIKTYADFNGFRFYSDNVDFKKAYFDVYGVSREIYQKYTNHKSAVICSLRNNLQSVLNSELQYYEYDNVIVLLEAIRILGKYYDEGIISAQKYFDELDLFIECKNRLFNILSSFMEIKFDNKETIHLGRNASDAISGFGCNNEECLTKINYDLSLVSFFAPYRDLLIIDQMLDLINKINNIGLQEFYNAFDDLEISDNIKEQIMNCINNLLNYSIEMNNKPNIRKKNN